MTLDAFIKEINDELSQDCQIPFQIPKRSLMRTIKYARKYFYKVYEYSVEEAWIFLPRTNFETDLYKQKKKVYLCDEVQSVFEVYRLNGVGILGDFSIGRLSAQEIFRRQYYAYEGGGALDYFLIKQVYFDWMKTMLVTPITFDYNFNTNGFTVMGEDPKADLALKCYVSIPDEDLFKDELFFRYVVAHAKVNLARILGTIRMPLGGDAEIDYDGLKSDGKDEMAEIKQEIKDSEGTDWFMVQ
jgi:hypothetical protein